MTALDRELLVRAFRLVAAELAQAKARAEVVLAGGAVMALMFDHTRVTRDVDGVVVDGHGPLIAATRKIAAELKLPTGWFNEGVAMYLSTQADPARPLLFDHSNLIIYRASIEHMIALKARAARAQDLDDLKLLAASAGVDSPDQVLSIVNEFFPDDPIGARARAVVVDLFDTAAGGE